jgi:hypothetical protein
MSSDDPLKHVQNLKCKACGAGLRVLKEGAQWIVYHQDPWCAWFGQRHAEKLAQLEREKAERAAIDAKLRGKR